MQRLQTSFLIRAFGLMHLGTQELTKAKSFLPITRGCLIKLRDQRIQCGTCATLPHLEKEEKERAVAGQEKLHMRDGRKDRKVDVSVKHPP